jgi:signal transduction histidine kinase
LAKAASRVAQGDFNLRAQPGNLPETRELAVAFNVMLDSLERHRRSLEKAKEQMRQHKTLAEMGEFSLTIAHEFKNPLSIIKSSLDVLKNDFAISSDNTFVFYIEDEIMRLNRLIGDFLMFARPVAPSFEQADLNGLLKEVVTRFDLQKSGVSCKIILHIPPVPCYFRVDPDLLIRSLGNIIKNAFEVNGDDCVVQVTATMTANGWAAEIADNGVGIAPEDISRIFNPFFTTRAKGAGLGLSYALRAINVHGGVITAANRPEGGALFRVELPI